MNTSTGTIRDQFGLTDIIRIRPAAFAVVSRLQDTTPGEQIMATAIALRALVRGAGLDMSQVLNAAERCERDADAAFTHHMRAIQEYAKHEMNRDVIHEATWEASNG